MSSVDLKTQPSQCAGLDRIITELYLGFPEWAEKEQKKFQKEGKREKKKGRKGQLRIVLKTAAPPVFLSQTYKVGSATAFRNQTSLASHVQTLWVFTLLKEIVLSLTWSLPFQTDRAMPLTLLHAPAACQRAGEETFLPPETLGPLTGMLQVPLTKEITNRCFWMRGLPDMSEPKGWLEFEVYIHNLVW